MGEICSRVIAKSEYAARVGIQQTFQNYEIPLQGNASSGLSTRSIFDGASRGGKLGDTGVGG